MAARRNIKLLLLLALLLTIPMAKPAKAHPHVWVDVVTDILFDKRGRMIGFKYSWVFDESYSVLAVQGLDKNRNRKFSSKELAPLLKSSLNSLKDWDYFSYAKINGKNVPLKKLRNARMSYKQDKIHLSFELYMNKPVDTSNNNIRFSVYDRSFYNLMSFVEKDPIWLGKHAPESCSFLIHPAKRGDRDTAEIADSYIESLGEGVTIGAQFAEWAELDCKPQ